jgi:hypothetical protein
VYLFDTLFCRFVDLFDAALVEAALADARAHLLVHVRQRSGLSRWGITGITGIHAQPVARAGGSELHLELRPGGVRTMPSSTASTEHSDSSDAPRVRSPASFTIEVTSDHRVILAATDAVGLHAGVGQLLRELYITRGRV